MSVVVSIPTILRPLTNNERSVTSEGETVEQVINHLDQTFPGLGNRLIENGVLRRFVNLYINDEDVRFLGGLTAPLADGDNITILPAVAGG